MGRRNRGRGGGRQRAAGGAGRDAETIKLVNELLAAQQVDVTQLRKVVAVRGLVNDGLRARVWPLLLGVEEPEAAAPDGALYAARHSAPHKDGQVVECDLARSLWSFTEGWSEEEREERRDALRRVLTAAVAGNAQGVHYYQGLHDVAAVLLFVCGERQAHRLLAHLASCHLRDCTRADLAAATEVLRLLYPILEQCDPQLYAYIQGLQEPALEVPYFALSWYMTWFAHEVPSLPQVARLFDLFIASHPLMPLYLAAVAIKSQREVILGCGEDGLQVYGQLKRMRFLQPGQPSADELARKAAALYRAAPPALLARARGIRLESSTAAEAYLAAGRWRVPAEPQKRLHWGGAPAPFARLTIEQLQAVFRPPPRPGRRRAAALALLTSVTSLAAVGAAVLLSQVHLPWAQ